MIQFVPKGIRPPGLVPAHPRVIYKTKRNNLTHEGRIGRIDRIETLEAFGQFSRRFHAHRPRLHPEEAAYLHNNGFLPDKGALYGFPREDMDSYLSDFQADILPMANGRYAAALSNRLMFWRLYGRILPLAPLVAAVQSGRRIAMNRTAAAGDILLARPMMTADRSAPLREDTPRDGGGDRCILALPGLPEEVRVLRVLVLYNPKTRLPEVHAAVALTGPLTALDQPGTALTSRRVDTETGIAGPALRFVRGAVGAAECVDRSSQALPEWWAMVRDLTAGLAVLPVPAVMQFDVIPGRDGVLVIDATDRVDPAAFQVHGPLMGSRTAVEFLREFGV